MNAASLLCVLAAAAWGASTPSSGRGQTPVVRPSPSPSPAIPALPSPKIPALAGSGVPITAPGTQVPATQTLSRLEQALSEAHAAQGGKAPEVGQPEQERAYDGSAEKEASVSAEAPSTPLPGTPLADIKAQAPVLLDYLVAEKVGWLSTRQSVGQGLLGRIDAVAANKGLPRRVPDGLFKTRVVYDPVAPELLGALPEMAGVIRRLMERSPNPEIGLTELDQFTRWTSDLFYSFGKLTERAETREKLLEDWDWLWGTYHLGEPRRK